MKNKINIPNDSLMILVGVPGSGKSTLAEKIASGDKKMIVSSDDIRNEINGDELNQSNATQVFDIFYERIEERLKKGEKVIADSTGIDDFSRKILYDLAKKYNRPIRIVRMNIFLEDCLRQNAGRNKRVPEEVLIRRFDKLKREYSKIDREVDELTNAEVYDIIKLEMEREEKIRLKTYDRDDNER